MTAMISKRRLVVWALAAAALCAERAPADTITLQGTVQSNDATIFSGPPAADVNMSNGISNLAIGRNGSGENRRALVYFDFSTFNQITAGSQINSVQLSMRLSSAGGGPATVNIEMHRLSTAWIEPSTGTIGASAAAIAANTNDPTWNSSAHNAALWTTAGGDYVTDASSTTTVGNTANQVFNWTDAGATGSVTLTSDVRNMFDNPSINFGWILIGNEVTSNSIRQFFSSEGASANQPTLTINYTPNAVPEPSSFILAGINVALVAGARVWRARRRKNPASAAARAPLPS